MFNPTDHAALSPTRVSKRALLKREERLLLAPHMNKSYQPYLIPGKQVDVPTVSVHLGVRNTGTGASYSPETFAVGTTSITINNDKEASATVDDRLELESVIDVANLLTKEIGYAHAHNIDATLIAHYSDVASPLNLSVTGKITEQKLRDMEEQMDIALWPSTDRFGVFYPTQKAAIHGMAEWRSQDFIGPGEALRISQKGELPKMMLSWVPMWTTQCPSDTTVVSGQTSRIAFFWHKDAIALCMEKEHQVEKRRTPRAFSWDYVSRTIFADKVMRADHIGYIASL